MGTFEPSTIRVQATIEAEIKPERFVNFVTGLSAIVPLNGGLKLNVEKQADYAEKQTEEA